MPYSFIPEYLAPYSFDSGGPWWMCSPKAALTPCPIRPTGFVSLQDYDEDFKYPLASSRIAKEIVRSKECTVCQPTMIYPSEPPEEECISIMFHGGCGCNLTIAPEGVSGWPSWFNASLGFQLNFDTVEGQVTAVYSEDEAHPGQFILNGEISLYGPLTGTGTLLQGAEGPDPHEICVYYNIPEGS